MNLVSPVTSLIKKKVFDTVLKNKNAFKVWIPKTATCQYILYTK